MTLTFDFILMYLQYQKIKIKYIVDMHVVAHT